MPESRENLYKYHVANLRSVTSALQQVARLTRHAIAKDDRAVLLPLIRVYGLLLGAWAESRLRKVIYEDHGFDNEGRDRLLSAGQQYERWRLALEISFRKHYKVPNAELTPPALSHSAHSRYQVLVTMLENDLRPIIEMRNKLAHGQWVYALANDEVSVAQYQIRTLNTETFFSLQSKLSLIDGLATLVHDLVVSKSTFERDFDKHFRSVEQTRTNLLTRPYKSYVEQLKQRYRKRPAR